MTGIKDLQCDFCEHIIKEDDEYCVNCGHIFVDDALCNNHEDTEADGVCIICSYAFCGKCGVFQNGVFLCNEHKKYEVLDSFAKIYSSEELTEIEYLKNVLADEGFHPVLVDKKTNRISLAGTEYSFFNSEEDSSGIVLNEIKLFVPAPEALDAEAVLQNLNETEDSEE